MTASGAREKTKNSSLTIIARSKPKDSGGADFETFCDQVERKVRE